MRRRIRYLLPALAALVVGFAPGAASADAVAEFYEGKTVTIVVAAGPGGDHTKYSQHLAELFKKYMPGNPSFVTQNMGGAGGTKAANFLYNSAPKDGSTIGILLSTTPIAARLRNTGIKYNPKEFEYLGGADVTRSAFMVMSRTGVATIEEAMKKEVVLGATGKSSQTYMVPAMANALIGTKFKMISGYRGFGGVMLAIDRGEVDGFQGVWSAVPSLRPQWLASKTVNVLATLSLDGLPDRPDVPRLIDLVKDPADKKLVELMAAIDPLGRCWLAPPGVPADRVAALRTAFAKALADPTAAAGAKKRNMHWEPVKWQDLQAQAAKIADADDALVARLREVVSGKM